MEKELEYHIPVLLNESIEGLNIKPDGVYVDVTFGGGGHSAAILSKLDTGKLISFDQDADAEKNAFVDPRFLFVRSNFRYFRNFLRYHGYEKVDGILADLGVSSHHFDSPERGFSFRFDADLDMRMNRNAQLTAADVVNTYSTESLTRIFRDYGELKQTNKAVSLIDAYRSENMIETTSDLLKVLEPCTPKFGDNKFMAQVFQALRIEVNKELEVLAQFLTNSERSLNVGGRLVVITYHSLEDRMVKNFIRSGKLEGEADKDIFGNSNTPFDAVNRKVILPSDEEQRRNPRSRSAKMRIGERTED